MPNKPDPAIALKPGEINATTGRILLDGSASSQPPSLATTPRGHEPSAKPEMPSQPNFAYPALFALTLLLMLSIGSVVYLFIQNSVWKQRAMESDQKLFSLQQELDQNKKKDEELSQLRNMLNTQAALLAERNITIQTLKSALEQHKQEAARMSQRMAQFQNQRPAPTQPAKPAPAKKIAPTPAPIQEPVQSISDDSASEDEGSFVDEPNP